MVASDAQGLPQHNDSAYYRRQIEGKSDENIANLAITLIHQTDYLMTRYFERVQRDFVEQGGITEQLATLRRDYRNKKPRPPQG